MSLRPQYKETALNFRRPNVEFSKLQNVKFGLRTSDGDFADIAAVAIRKRPGTEAFGNEISSTGEMHTMLSYINNTYDYLIAGHGTNLYKFAESTLANPIVVGDTVIDLVSAANFATSGDVYIGENRISYTGKAANQLTGVTGIPSSYAAGTRVIQRIWKSIKSGLTSGLYFTGAVMDSYSGTAAVSGTHTPKHTGTWTTVAYDVNTNQTTLTDNTKSWQVDALIGRKLKPNTGDYPDLEYDIVENNATQVKVEGDIKGLVTTTADDIAYSTLSVAAAVGAVTVDLVSATDFRATGGTANIEGDMITYTGKAGNQLTGVTGIDVAHAVGAGCSSGEVVLTSVTGLASNGPITIGGYSIYYNGIIGKKLLNLSNVEVAIADPATVTNSNYKTAVGKSYAIEFSQVSTRIVDTTKSWTDDAYQGYIVHIYGGKGVGQQRTVTSNKKDYLEVAFSWEEEPDATSTYKLYANSDQILYMGNGTDSLLRFDGTTVTALSDAPKGNITMAYQSRLFIAKDYTVNYSDVGDPEFFSPIFTITPLGDDKITGLAEWNGNGIIFKERSIWKFNFSFNSQTSQWDIDLVQIPSNSGCISHRTIQKVENVLWFFDGKAVKYLGASPNQIGVIRTEDISFPVYQDLDNISETMRPKAVSVYDGKNYLMFTTALADDTSNNIGYDYDSTFTGWSTRTGNNVSSVVFHKGVRYYGSASSGQAYRMDIDDSYLDDATPVDMIVSTKDTDFGNPSVFKTYRFGVFEFENEDSSVEYNSKVYTTRNTLTREGEWDIGFGLGAGAGMGGAGMGEGLMGAGSEVPRRVVRKLSIGVSGTRVQHILRNRKDENMSIVNISTVWHARTMRHFPSPLIS